MAKARTIDRRQFLRDSIVTGLAVGCHVSAGSAQQQDVHLASSYVADEKHLLPDTSFGAHIVGNQKLRLRISATTSSLVVYEIQNQATGVEHLQGASNILRILGGPSQDLDGDQSLVIHSVHVPAPGSLQVAGSISSLPVISFLISFSPHPSRGEVTVHLRLRNHGLVTQHLRLVFPDFGNLVTTTKGYALKAALPQEAGGVVSFSEKVKLGMELNSNIGLPNAMNMMELVSIYDPLKGGGIYMLDGSSDLESGHSPLQFTLVDGAIHAYWTTEIPAASEESAPLLVIGVHDSGDWHIAVDAYNTLHQQAGQEAVTPSWLRDQGALYSFSGAGAGAIYMTYPQQDLNTRIGSFQELPKLLEEAQSLGTNIVYLWDYWEGTKEGGHAAYWNKGDYVPRLDLGGATAFKEGIKNIHDRRGRVICYLEWFIMYWYSDIGKQKGELWAARDYSGTPYKQYSKNFSLSPVAGAWHTYLIGVAERLVRDFDVDGIYLDSMGWQMNWPAMTLSENRRYNSQQYSAGALDLVDTLRAAIRTIKADAVVLGENTGGQLCHHMDGGLSADFAWLAEQNQHKMLASPARYGLPALNIYSNGKDRNQMHQVFAAGHSLALANVHLKDAEYIRKLVDIRQTYKDALIYGRQFYQPKTTHPEVVAYLYRGSLHEVITLVNTSSESLAIEMKLTGSSGHSTWMDVVNDRAMTSGDGVLRTSVSPEDLRVLVRPQTPS